MTCELLVDGVSKYYDNQRAIGGLSFEVLCGEFLTFVGPSGSGKTTLLKLLAGFEDPDAGRILRPQGPHHQSPVILVFQDYQLFPHLTVTENVAFGLTARRWKKAARDEKVSAILLRLGIEHRASAYPARLSGGEKQRVALARALVLEPAVLLLDEPFANLDPNLKAGTAAFLRTLTRELGTTVVCVTHDFDEAFLMSDRVGILLGGELVQLDTPRGLFQSPASKAVAEFLGPVNDFCSSDDLRWSHPQVKPPQNWVRAERLEFRSDPFGTAEIREVRFYGTRLILEVLLKEKLWLVASLDPHMEPGQRGNLFLK